MDRLICGDVGYGKTEVAIRAAFKSVMGGKQVAILVPTTILAQQHFNTFRERTADYPVRVEQLSRFCSRRDQGRIVRQLAEAVHRHRHRDASPSAGRCWVQGFGAGGDRRRAALRGHAQGEIQIVAQAGRCADLERDADTAHALSGADGRARHEHDRDAAPGPIAGGNHCRTI